MDGIEDALYDMHFLICVGLVPILRSQVSMDGMIHM